MAQPHQPQQQHTQHTQQSQQSQQQHVIILDLDGTVVGDVTYALLRHQLLTLIRQQKLRGPNAMDVLTNALKPSLKLIRPGFQQFMKRYAKHEIFVFTASERRWAHIILPCIEKALNVRFNRPFFTRDDCIKKADGSLVKNFELIKHKVVNAIKKKLGRNSTQQQHIQTQNGNLKHKVTVIDNAPVWENPFHQCPTYNFVGFHDLLADISVETLLNPTIQVHVRNLISQGHCYDVYSGLNMDPVKALYFKSAWLAKKSRIIYNANRPHHKDQFWNKCVVEHI